MQSCCFFLFFFLPTFSWKFQISQKLSIRFSRNFAQSFYTQWGPCVCKGIKIVWLGERGNPQKLFWGMGEWVNPQKLFWGMGRAPIPRSRAELNNNHIQNVNFWVRSRKLSVGLGWNTRAQLDILSTFFFWRFAEKIFGHAEKPYFFKKKQTFFSFQFFLNHDLITCLRVLGAIRTWTTILFNGSWGVGQIRRKSDGNKVRKREISKNFFSEKKDFFTIFAQFSKIQSQWVVSAQITAQQDRLAYLRQF